MLIKSSDSKEEDIAILQSIAERSDITTDTKKMVEQEMRNIRSGIKGETEAAYEIDFHYAQSKNWMVIHDLRLECEGRVAQIDHLVINRFLDMYVCESKRFSEGVGISEQGEFTAFFNGKPYGIPSPLEQNRRHMIVLESVFKSGQVALPKRLGISIRPSLNGLVLVSRTARISRPKRKIDGIEQVIKNDQLKSRIDKDFDSDNNPLTAVKIVGQDTLEEFARRLAAAHKPIRFDWHAKFGVSRQPPAPTVSEPKPVPFIGGATEVGDNDGEKKSKLICSTCGEKVAYNVAKFCWFNKQKFGGNVYCMECQKSVVKTV